jgi:hypothetical protein
MPKMDRGLFYYPNHSGETWLFRQEEEKTLDIAAITSRKDWKDRISQGKK